MLEMDSSVGSVGSRKRVGKHYTVEDEALDRIAKEVGPRRPRPNGGWAGGGADPDTDPDTDIDTEILTLADLILTLTLVLRTDTNTDTGFSNNYLQISHLHPCHETSLFHK